MNLQRAMLLGGLAVACFAFSLPAEAQSFFGQNQRSNSQSGAGMRLLFVFGSSALGFGLGWLTTDNAKGARLMIGAAIGFVILLMILLINGPVGWSLTMLASIVGFTWAIGWWARVGLRKLAETPTTFGSSRWAIIDDLQDGDVIGDDGISLGETFAQNPEDIEFISYKGDRHLLTIAPTRSGKGTTQIIPNLLTYEGSMLVIDPKGENAMITAKRREAMGHAVHVVDPWGIVDLGEEDSEDGSLFVNPDGNVSTFLSLTSRFNPLDWLDINDMDITENSMILADALVVGENHGDSFWTEEAKALLQGIILYVATDTQEDGQRHLGRVRDLLLLDGEEQQLFFQHMVQSTHHIVRSTGARCLQKEPKLIANVMAAAQAQTHFLDSERLRDNLKSSSFKFDELKTQPITIYLVLPADRLNTFGRWLRLLVQQAITVNARNIEVKPDKPILFVLDEFAALGRLTMVEQAFGLMAGFGMQLWGIVQDLSQLERVYGDGWQSFIANAGMVNYFGSSDQKTAEYFSALCGETTVWNFSTAVSHAFGSSKGGGSGASTSDTITNSDTHSAVQRKLIYPDELMRLSKDKQLVLIESVPPLMAKKVAWFDDEELKELGVNLEAESDLQDETEFSDPNEPYVEGEEGYAPEAIS